MLEYMPGVITSIFKDFISHHRRYSAFKVRLKFKFCSLFLQVNYNDTEAVYVASVFFHSSKEKVLHLSKSCKGKHSFPLQCLIDLRTSTGQYRALYAIFSPLFHQAFSIYVHLFLYTKFEVRTS